MVIRNNINQKEQVVSKAMWDKLTPIQKNAFTVLNDSDETKPVNVVENKVEVKKVAAAKKQAVPPSNGEKKK